MKQSKIANLIYTWQRDTSVHENIIDWVEEPERNAVFADFPDGLDPLVINALKAKGIHRPFYHQTKSWEAILNGKNVVLATGTSSGKTICYTVPIMNTILHDPSIRALMLFPTKALAQDQEKGLKELVSAMENGAIRVGVYDGDTPSSQRQIQRRNAQVLITNPDMLHLGILPRHTSWMEFFRNLCFVVIDEIHTYRGVFGSHVANVIRRLKRITQFYGSHPLFIMTSATIANPLDLAAKLVEEPVVLIDEDASPHSKRYFLLYNPPIIDANLGIRRSASSESIHLADDLIQNHIQAILFAQTRRAVEMLLLELKARNPMLSDHINGYRSGYLAQERREIEKNLREGIARVVVATNALELGIDIGGLEAIVLVGYPGSIAATRQQIGRAGRREDESIAILVASSAPVDQYLMRHTDYLIGRSPENAYINPDNQIILEKHLKCAVFELPLSDEEINIRPNSDHVVEILKKIIGDGLIHHSKGRYYWIANQYPASDMSIRSVSGGVFTLEAQNNNGQPMTIGKVDEASALWMVHPGAIYLHEGTSYYVEELLLDQNKALLRPILADYFTLPKQNIEIVKIDVELEQEIYGSQLYLGHIQVDSTVTGYRRVSWANEELGNFPLDLPTTHLFTKGVWLNLGEDAIHALQEKGLWNRQPNYYGSQWGTLRHLVLNRDNYTCQFCGAKDISLEFHVHHKIPFKNFLNAEQANHLSNLITLCPRCHQLAETAVRVRSGLSGLGYALLQLSPLFILCDSKDLGLHVDSRSPMNDQRPALILYDQIPSGIGLSDAIFERFSDLLRHVAELISTCACKDGCPSCVGPGGENGSGGKEEALALVKLMIGESLS